MGQGHPDRFRIGLIAAGLIANQALTIQAGHHARKHQIIAFKAGVDADGHLTAPLQFPQEGPFRQAAPGGWQVFQHFDLA